MRAIELFAGVGGFRLGLERAGIEVIWANEINRYAADVYDKNFGGQIDRRDITTVTAAEIPEHDLLTGGFPCQAFSVAGKRRGFEDTRGTLFFDICRILRHHRPGYLFLENVKGLLSHEGGETFATILRSLDELGYDCQWQVCNSKDFGVPQHRERVFIVGHLRGRPRPQVFPIRAADQENPPDAVPGGAEARTALIDVAYPGRKRAYLETAPTVRDYGSGGNKMPMVFDDFNQKMRGDALAGTLTPNTGSRAERNGQKVVTRQPLRFLDRNQKNIDGDYAFTADASQTSGVKVTNGYGTDNRVASEDGVSPTLISVAKSNGKQGGVGDRVPIVSEQIRRLTPVECERLQGFPDGWTAGVSDTQRYKQMGNAVTVNVVAAIAERLAGVPV